MPPIHSLQQSHCWVCTLNTPFTGVLAHCRLTSSLGFLHSSTSCCMHAVASPCCLHSSKNHHTSMPQHHIALLASHQLSMMTMASHHCRRASGIAPLPPRNGITPWSPHDGITPSSSLGSITPPSPPSGIAPKPAASGIAPPTTSIQRRRPPHRMESIVTALRS